MTRICLDLTPRQLAAVDVLAYRRNSTRSGIMLEALYVYLREEKRCSAVRVEIDDVVRRELPI